MPLPVLDNLVCAVYGAVDTVRYAQAFVAHAHQDHVGLDTNAERELILEEELGPRRAVLPEVPFETP